MSDDGHLHHLSASTVSAKCIFAFFVNTFSVLLHCTESVNNRDITSRYEEAAALSRFLSAPPPLTLPLTFYLRQHIICSLSVHTVCRFRASQDAAITQRNEHVSKLLCWYPYLWRGFYSLRPGPGRAGPGSGIICTPVTSTSSSACNLSFKRWCRLCSPPVSLGDVWQCADRYDYP